MGNKLSLVLKTHIKKIAQQVMLFTYSFSFNDVYNAATHGKGL